jgi:hypothetical protein
MLMSIGDAISLTVDGTLRYTFTLQIGRTTTTGTPASLILVENRLWSSKIRPMVNEFASRCSNSSPFSSVRLKEGHTMSKQVIPFFFRPSPSRSSQIVFNKLNAVRLSAPLPKPLTTIWSITLPGVNSLSMKKSETIQLGRITIICTTSFGNWRRGKLCIS